MSTLKTNTLSNVAGTASTAIENAINGSAKAWVNFNGTGTVAIRASYNVSSITDNGSGDYTLNFTNAFADVNYNAVFGVGSQTGTQTRFIMEQHDNIVHSTSQLRIYTLNAATSPADSGVVSVSCFR
jgi:NADH:ubiquinone oxidoreductase subunit F (NADH-binding)